MTTRRGMGKGRGKGYRNIIGKDPRVHSDSAMGRKQPQRIPFVPAELARQQIEATATIAKEPAKTAIDVAEGLGDSQLYTPEQFELYVINNYDLYRQMYVPIGKALDKKMAKGNYDREKARKAYLNLVNEGARRLAKQEKLRNSSFIISAKDKREVARSLEESYFDEYNLGQRY